MNVVGMVRLVCETCGKGLTLVGGDRNADGTVRSGHDLGKANEVSYYFADIPVTPLCLDCEDTARHCVIEPDAVVCSDGNRYELPIAPEPVNRLAQAKRDEREAIATFVSQARGRIDVELITRKEASYLRSNVKLYGASRSAPYLTALYAIPKGEDMWLAVVAESMAASAALPWANDMSNACADSRDRGIPA